MKKPIIMLDTETRFRAVPLMSKCLEREIHLFHEVGDYAQATSSSRSNYCGTIVEPFTCFNNSTNINTLQRSLVDSMSYPGFKVVVYTTQDLETLEREFGLRQGTHYQEFIIKAIGSAQKLMNLLKNQE